MVARSAYTQPRYSPWLLAGTLAGLVCPVLPPVSAIAGLIALAGGAGRIGAGPPLCAAAGAARWAAMAVSYLPMLRLYRLSPMRAPTLPAIALMYAVHSARRLVKIRGPGAAPGKAGRACPASGNAALRKRRADSR